MRSPHVLAVTLALLGCDDAAVEAEQPAGRPAITAPVPSGPSAAPHRDVARHRVEPEGLPALGFETPVPRAWLAIAEPGTSTLDPDILRLGLFVDPMTDSRVTVRAIRLHTELAARDWVTENLRRRGLEVLAERVDPREPSPAYDVLARARDGAHVERIVAFRHGAMLVMAVGHAPASRYPAVADVLARATLGLRMLDPRAPAPPEPLARFDGLGPGRPAFSHPARWQPALREQTDRQAVVDLTLTDGEHIGALIRVRVLARAPGPPGFARAVELERDALRRNGAAIAAADEPSEAPAPAWATAAQVAETRVVRGGVPSVLTTLVGATADRLIAVSAWAPTPESGSGVGLIAKGALGLVWVSIRPDGAEAAER